MIKISEFLHMVVLLLVPITMHSLFQIGIRKVKASLITMGILDMMVPLTIYTLPKGNK